MSTQDIEQAIIERAWQDDSFRQSLVENPKDAVADAFGVEIPEGVDFQVMEETATQRYMVLPANPSAAGELSDEDLDVARGGYTDTCVGTVNL